MPNPVRSTFEPNLIELKRVTVTDSGPNLNLLVHWDIQSEQVPEPKPHTEYVYKESSLSVPYNGPKSQITDFLSQNQKQLLLKAKSKFEEVEDTDILSTQEKLELDELQQSTVFATISDIDDTKTDSRYVQVEKTIDNQTVSTWCYVTYSVLLCHRKAQLSIGDYVIIDFVDNDLSKPIVLDKIIGKPNL